MEERKIEQSWPVDHKKMIKSLGKEFLTDVLKKMLLIRNFEVRGEAAYQQGKVGGFFHSYIGQEAIALGAVLAMGLNDWYITSYRCHGFALLLGATPKEMMAELYGKATGNVHGRGGSMHMFTDKFLGGYGVVGSQIPIGIGAAFSIKYKGEKDRITSCFLGDGATAQGSFHECVNLASLWSLPIMFCIENNHWGIGTAIDRAVCVEKLAEDRGPSYNMHGYTIDGMDFFACYQAFKKLRQEVLETGRPVIVEAITERFRGHSVSDAGLYRTKEQLKEIMEHDPLLKLKGQLIDAGVVDEEGYKALDGEMRNIVLEAMEYADKSPWPELTVLEEGVYV